jgi:hypothetical protein
MDTAMKRAPVKRKEIALRALISSGSLFPVQPDAGIATLGVGQATEGRNPVRIYPLDINPPLALMDLTHVRHESASAHPPAPGRLFHRNEHVSEGKGW